MSNKPKPKLKQILHSVTLPVSNTLIQYRSYNVADERILVAAATAKNDDVNFYIDNTINVISGVVLNDIDIAKQPSIDARFLMLHVRAKSVGELIEFKLDGEEVAANINDFFVQNPRKNDDYKIDIDGEYGLLMRETTFEEDVRMSAEINENNKSDIIYKLMVNSVKAIYTKDEYWNVGEDISKEDVEEFLGTIPATASKKLYEFIVTMPTLAVEIFFKGTKRIITNKEVDFLSSASATSAQSTTTS